MYGIEKTADVNITIWSIAVVAERKNLLKRKVTHDKIFMVGNNKTLL